MFLAVVHSGGLWSASPRTYLQCVFARPAGRAVGGDR